VDTHCNPSNKAMPFWILGHTGEKSKFHVQASKGQDKLNPIIMLTVSIYIQLWKPTAETHEEYIPLLPQIMKQAINTSMH